MPPKFLESLGSKLAERWLSTIFTPAFIFWAGGLATWIFHSGWLSLENWFVKHSQPVQIALIISLLLGVIISALIVQRCELTVLRLLEGYWPRWLRKLEHFYTKNQQNKKKKLDQKLQLLIPRINNKNQFMTLQAKEEYEEEIKEYARLDSQLHYFPTTNLMPTQLGNILRASEERPQNQYGLDTFICWPRLWLLLPDSVKNELTEARITLNTGARIWLWSILFIGWTPLAWWAFPVSILSAWLAYNWLLNSAIIYGDLLESSFDLYRFKLYKSLRWPLPNSPEEERRLGKQLTAYLWKRPEIFSITFTDF